MVECCENPQKHHSAIFDKYNDKRFKRASHFVETEMRRGFQVLDILAGSGSNPELYEPKKSWSHKWKTVSLISKFSPQARPSNIFIIQTTPYHGLSSGHNSSKSRFDATNAFNLLNTRLRHLIVTYSMFNSWRNWSYPSHLFPWHT